MQHPCSQQPRNNRASSGTGGHARSHHAFLARSGGSVMALALLAPPAAALDTSIEGGLVTQTIASPDSAGRDYAGREGMRLGNFMAFPSVEATTTFDDNIFRSDAQKESDVRIEVVPSVVVKSQLPRHILDFALTGKIVEFAEHQDQSYSNAAARLSGGLHFDHAHTLGISMLSEYVHQEKGLSLTPRDAASPVPIFHNNAAVGLTRDAGRLFGTLSFSADRYDFFDVKGLDGATLDQDFRDTDVFTAQLRTGYRFSPGFQFVTKLKALRQLNDGNELTSTQSTGFEATAGVEFQTSSLLKWHLLGGYGVRDFDRDNTSSVTSSLFEGGLEWRPSERMTLNGALSRAINAETSGEGTGVVSTTLSASLDYEIYHNLIAHAGVTATDSDFLSTERRDREYGFNTGLDYQIAPNWDLTLGYDYTVRQSTIDAADMTNNKVRVGAKLRF